MSPSDDDGIELVLSAAQLAAVLASETVSADAAFGNRLWGGLKVVGGVLELVGAGALCLLPEPTMASKAGCVIFGAHGTDTTVTGARQIWTGVDTQSLTHDGVSKLARTLGVESKLANNIGLAVDIGVPVGLSAAIGALRVASVKAGRINLAMHEAPTVNAIGGHTILKHLGQNEVALRARLASMPSYTKAISTFSDLRTAEEAISKALKLGAPQITKWAQKGASGMSVQNLELILPMGKTIGHGVVRSTGQLTKMNKVRIWLKYETFNGQPYYILSAHPVL